MLEKILWVFNHTSYTDKNSFNQAVIDYQHKIRGNADNWQPNAIVLELPQVYIQYGAWINGLQDLLENENLFVEELDYIAKNPPDYKEYGYQVEVLAKLTTDNGKNFTNLELLQKIHNQIVNKELGDHVFFEDLEQVEDYNGLPTYNVWCGS